jgi:hypothetical protein
MPEEHIDDINSLDDLNKLDYRPVIKKRQVIIQKGLSIIIHAADIDFHTMLTKDTGS